MPGSNKNSKDISNKTTASTIIKHPYCYLHIKLFLQKQSHSYTFVYVTEVFCNFFLSFCSKIFMSYEVGYKNCEDIAAILKVVILHLQQQ